MRMGLAGPPCVGSSLSGAWAWPLPRPPCYSFRPLGPFGLAEPPLPGLGFCGPQGKVTSSCWESERTPLRPPWLAWLLRVGMLRAQTVGRELQDLELPWPDL